jgi:hypothetical protein
VCLHFEQYLPICIKLTIIRELHFGQSGDFGECVGEYWVWDWDCDCGCLVVFVVIDGRDSHIIILDS